MAKGKGKGGPRIVRGATPKGGPLGSSLSGQMSMPRTKKV